MEKDYNLLRPFDLEAAKRGELCMWHCSPERLEYVGEATVINYVGCFKWIDGIHKGTYETYEKEKIRMAPLCWVEGKPVYNGDVLYWGGFNICWVVTATDEGFKFDDGSVRAYDSPINDNYYFTWTKHKVKREGWVNIYKTEEPYFVSFVSHAFDSEEQANKHSSEDRIACIRIEWEE